MKTRDDRQSRRANAPWAFVLALSCGAFAMCDSLLARDGDAHAAQDAPLPHPILFVTQVPIAEDFGTIGSVFANHRGDIEDAGRGGDLYIVYPDGALRNLT